MEGDRLVGYASLTPPKLPFETDRRALELGQLYVLKPWQGAGVAPVLIVWLAHKAASRGWLG